MRGIVEASISGCKSLRVYGGICRHISGDGWSDKVALAARDAVGDAEALGAVAQVGFVKGDAHGDDFFVSPARGAHARAPGDGFDDQLYSLEPLPGGGVAKIPRRCGG